MLTEGIHAADREIEVKITAGRSHVRPPDVVDSARILSRNDIVTVHHGRQNTVEAGTGEYAGIVVFSVMNSWASVLGHVM